MAVSGDFFTLEGVSEVAEEGQRAFNMLMGVQQLDLDNLVQETIDLLNKRIKDLEGLESDFKAAFGCNSLEEFKQRVAAYYHKDYNLAAFTGTSLQNIVEDFKAQLDAQTAENQRRAELLFQGILETYMNGPYASEVEKLIRGEKIGEQLAEQIMYELRAMLNQNAGGGNLQLHSRHFRIEKNGVKESLSIVASKGTKAFKRYVDQAYEKAMQNGGQLSYKFKYDGQPTKNGTIQINTTTSVNNSKMNQTFGVKIAQAIRSSGTKMLTKTELEEKLKRGEITQHDISNKNREIINLVCDELKVDGLYRDFVKNRIGTMLTTDPYMFFVGNSFTNLEGILGEVNAVIAITHLLGPRYTDKALHWVGSQPGVYSKKQPSIDIIVDNLLGIEKVQFGIQVKNTMDEITDVAHYINFSNKDLAQILDAAGISSDAIESVYFSDTFNVPYKREGKFYERVGYGTPFRHNDFVTKALFDEYVRIDKLIDTIVDSINIYLARHAAEFTYMQYTTDENSFQNALAKLDNELINKGTKGNFCYIVGSHVFFANEMLTQLTTQLEALQSLKLKTQKADLQFETYFSENGTKGGEGFNIVEAMNTGKHLSNYTLKMRSSWGFHK